VTEPSTTDPIVTEPTALSITDAIVTDPASEALLTGDGATARPARARSHWISVVHSDTEMLADLRAAATDLDIPIDRHPDDLYLSNVDALKANFSRAGYLVDYGVRKTTHR
jgi:hypothetical protein